MAIASIFPATKPSLNLDFANTKSLDPRITFSRASTATYYDGKTVAKAEENLWYPSAGIPSGGALVTNTANAGVAPDGTATAFLSIPTVDVGFHLAGFKSINIASADQIFSFYAKPAGYDKIRVGDAASQRMYASFDLTLNLVTDTGGLSYLNSGVIDVGNGWKRCWLKFNNTGATSASIGVTPFPTGAVVDGYSRFSGSGDGVSGAYFWGFQLEQRSQVTAYTPTTTQPITNYIPVLQTAPAGVPRFDHNPVTGESLGLLVEEQRTSILYKNQEFTSTSWLKSGATIPASIVCVAPDGSLTGAKLAEDSIAGVHYIGQGVASSPGLNIYTISAYVKSAGRSRVQLWSSSGDPRFSARFDLVAKTATNLTNIGTAVISSSAITDVGNGWFRVSISGTTGTDNRLTPCLFLDDGSTHSYTGDGYSGVFVWGFSAEVGAFPTSYIKTEASQVTRSPDNLSMTGNNFLSWYRQDEGTFVYRNRPVGLSQTDRYHFIASETQGVVPNSVSSRTYGAAGIASVYVDSSTQSSFSYANMVVGKENNIAIAYKANDFAFSIGGSAAATDTSGLVPRTLSRFDILSNSCQHMARIAYYPKRLTDAQLQALTA